MARPDLNKLFKQQQNAKDKERSKIDSLLTGSTSKGYKQDNSTEFDDIRGYQNYINTGDEEFKGFDFTSDKDKSRAINQSNWEQVGNATLKFLPNVGLEIIKNVGNILDIEDYFNTDDEVGNWLSNWAEEKKKGFNERYAIYRENPEESFNIGDFAWWVDNGSSLVESMSAFVATGAIGGLALNVLRNGSKSLQALRALGLGTGTGRTTMAASQLANAVMLNHAEGMGIASNVYNDEYQKSLTKYKAQGLDDADLRAKQDAAKKAVSVVNVNRANILLNLTSASAFLKAPKYARQLRSAPSVRNAAKQALVEGGQEALEETINMIAENQARKENYGLSDIMDDVLSAQGAENALLGFVGGSGQTVLTNAGRKLKLQRDSEGRPVSSYQMQMEDFERQEANRRNIENLDSDGKLSENTDAFLRTKEAYILLDDIQDLKEQQEAFEPASKDYKNIENKIKSIQDKMLANQAYDAFVNGNAEHIENLFKQTATLTPDQAKEKGLPDDYKQRANEAVRYIGDLERAYNNTRHYVNSQDVYENRAASAGLTKYSRELNRDLTEAQKQATEDLRELGIDSIQFEDGKIIIEDYKATPKNVVDSLDSIRNYKSLSEDLDIVRNNQQELANRYENLTSEKTQNEIKSAIQEIRRKRKRLEDTNKLRQKQQESVRKQKSTVDTAREQKAASNEDRNNKQDVNPVNPQTETDTKPNSSQIQAQAAGADVTSDRGAIFIAPNEALADLTNKLNTGYSKAKTVEQKRKGLQAFANTLNANKNIPGAPGLLAQINKELRNVEQEEVVNQEKQQQAAASNTIIKEKAERLANILEQDEEVAPEIDADLAPLTEESRSKVHQQIDALLDLLDSIGETGVNVDSFVDVAKVVNDSLGEEQFASIFEKFKAVYTLATGKPTVDYTNIFGTTEEKQQIINNDEILKNNRLANDFYTLTQTEFEANRKEALKNYIETQGYKVYPKDVLKSDDKVKTVTAFNKIAHLDRKYITNIGSRKTDKFNILEYSVAKSDLDNVLNDNASPLLLDYDIINAGSEIEFVVLQDQVYDDGTIVTKDGVVIRNGEETQRDPVDIAPIAIAFDGEVVPGAFLHTTDWINEANLAFGEDVEIQRNKLRQIRETILNSPDRIRTTITNRNDGWLLKDVTGEKNTLANNLPKVELGIAKDGVLYSRENSNINVNNINNIKSGLTYAIIPTNKDRQFAIPVQPHKLNNHPEFIDSIIEAVKIYINNDPNDTRAKAVFDSADLDLTKISDLKKYIENFIYTVKIADNSFGGFKELINSIDDTKSVVRITGNSIDFGRGLNVGDTTRSLNRQNINSQGENRQRILQASLEKLRNVLSNNTYVAFDKNKLGTEFTLPIITANDVKTSTISYNDFVKQHTVTDLFGHKLPNGKTIYTVQSSFDFDTSFAFGNNTTKEPGEVKITEDNTTITDDDLDFDIEADEDFDIDFSPITLTQEQEEQFRATTPPSLTLQGVNLTDHQTIINYLSANIVKAVNERKSSTETYSILDEFANKLSNVALPKYRDMLAKARKAGNEQAIAKFEKQIRRFENIVEQYPTLVKLTLDNVRFNNNIAVDKDAIRAIQQDIEEGELTFDLESEEGELQEVNNWESDGVFREDVKTKMSSNVKNMFSYIEDAEFDEKGFAKPIKGIAGIKKVVPFDTVINDLTAALAYSNHTSENDITQPDFGDMVRVLEQWADSKPYFHNILERLDQATETEQNEFVSLMNKHYSHHIYVYKNKEGKTFANNSDGNTVINVLLDKWYNNLFNSDLIVENDKGNPIVNSSSVTDIKNKVKELVAGLKADTATNQDVADILNSIGLDIPMNVIDRIMKNGINYNNKPFSMLSLLTANDGAIKILIDRLDTIKNTNIEENHPFADNSALRQFARVLAKYNPVYFANSFKDVRGRSYYAYSQNKFLTDRFKTLKTNTDLLNQLANQPYSSTSTWVKELLDPNSSFKRHFGYFTFDGMSGADGFSKKLDNMSPAEIEEVKVALFFSGSRKSDKNYIVKLFYPTTSNKAVQYGIQVKAQNWGKINPSSKNLSKKQIDGIFDAIVLPEILRIQDAQDDSNRFDISGYGDGSLMFNHIPTLNAIKDIWEVEGSQRKLKADVTTNPVLKHKINVEIYNFVNQLVNEKISDWKKYGFVQTVETEDFNANGQLVQIREENLRHTGKDLREEAFNFVINYLIGNVNMYQTFITDPANFFKSKQYRNVLKRDGIVEELISAGVIDSEEEIRGLKRQDVLNFYKPEDWLVEHEDVFNNIGKRLAADAAPGIDVPETPGVSNRFTVAFLNDNERKSVAQRYLEALLGDDAKDYNDTAATDAQEFTTLAEHLYIMVKQGKITQAEADAIQNADDRGIKLTAEQLKVLNPLKPVYVNNVWRNGREVRVYIKSSSFPLYKQLTKGLEIDKLRKAMLNQGVDRVAFNTAVKIGRTNQSNTIYNKDAVDPGAMLSNIDLTHKQVLPRQGFKIQQDVPHDPFKDKINDGTQQRELLTGNLKDVDGFKLPNSTDSYTGRQIQEKLDDAYNRHFKLQYDRLVDRLNYNPITGDLDMASLSKLLQEEALERGYPINDIEGLGLKTNSSGELEFTVPLWLLGNSSKIEAMLNSIVDNKVRKIKSKGKSFVLGSSEGFKPLREGKEAQDIINNTTGIVWNKDWYNRTDGQLQPMVIKDKNGNVYGSKDFDQASSFVDYAEVLVPFKFKDNNGNLLNVADFTTKDGFIDTDKLNPELLNLFGFRIPTQYLNSMSAIKIVGFLPKQSGDLVLAPADFTIQMGSDFDVDKLYTNSYHTSFDGNKLTKFTSEEDTVEGLQNEILDLHFAILGNPDPNVQSKILKPLDFGQLKHGGRDLIDQVYPHVASFPRGRGMTEAYQTFKYQNARAGKIGIGVFSNDNTFISSVQDKDIYLHRKTKKGFIPVQFNLGGRTSNFISATGVNTPGSTRTKTDVISAFQSLAVDDENEQGFFKLNINKHTFDAIRALVMSGFEEDAIIYLINQPIIRRYVQLATDAEDTNIDFKTNQIYSTLRKEFPVENEEDLDGIDYSLEYYYKGITGEVVDNVLQRTAYNLFAEVTGYGQSIQGVQSAVNTSSAGIGKNLIYSNIKEEQLYDLVFNSRLANVKNLIGDFIRLQTDIDVDKGITLPGVNEADRAILESSLTEWAITTEEDTKKEIIDTIMELGYKPITPIMVGDKFANNIAVVKAKTIRGFASTDALALNNRLWSRFFPYNTRGIKRALNDLELADSRVNVHDQGVGARSAKRDKLFKEIKRYTITKAISNITDGDVVSERQRLFMDTKDNMALGNVLTSIIKNTGLSNEFINRLQINPKKSVLPTLITYNASAAENVNELPINTAILSMLNNDKTDLGIYNGINYTPRKLMQDLIAYQFLGSGVQGSKEFIKYIPVSYLNSLGFYETIDKTDFSNYDDFPYDSLRNQYLQHNPKVVELDPEQTRILKENYKFEDKGTRLIQDTEINTPLPKMFSIPNKSAVSGFRLYTFNREANEYRQVDTLGTSGYYEYNINEDFASSTIPSNQTPFVEPTTPKPGKDTKNFLKINAPSSDPEIIYDSSALGVVEYFDLTNQGTTKERLGFIMSKIADNSSNPFNSVIAKEIADKLDVIEDFRFIVNNRLTAEGSFSLNNKTIMINPSNIRNREHFEDVILEEVIHALTKQSILDNNTGEVARLKGLRDMAETLVMEYLLEQGIDPGNAFADVIIKLEEGRALTKLESDLIYPVINDTEFIGRLFKSKKLQELLNEVSGEVQNGSLLDRILNFIIDTLNSLGLDIKKGSALEYGIKDVISLIRQQTPSYSVQGDLQSYNPVYRTKEFIETKFNIREEDGSLREFHPDKAKEIAKWINTNIINLSAEAVDNFVTIQDKPTGSQLGLFEDFSPVTEEQDDFNRANALKKAYANRLANVEKNIQKAESAQNFEKAEELKVIKNNLQESLLEVDNLTSLVAVHNKALQDMQEVRDMLNSTVTLEDTLYIRKVINFWKKGIDLLFDENDRQSETLIKMFKEVEAEAEKYNDQLKVYEDKHINNLIRQYGSTQTVDEIFRNFQDINGLSALTLDISRSGNALLDSVFLTVKDANVEALDESKEIVKKVNDLEAKVRPVLRKFGDKELYDIFRQRTKSGKLTGHIVKRFTSDFSKELNRKLKILDRNNNAVNFQELLNWSKKNVKRINLNYLIPIQQLQGEEAQKAQAYRDKLRAELGDEHYEQFVAEQSKLINKYNKTLGAKYNNLVGKYNINSFTEFQANKEAKAEYQEWIETHSPYKFYDFISKGLPQRLETSLNFNNGNFVSFIPNSDRGYDENFKQITADPDLLNFYNYYNEVIDDLKEFLPADVRRDLAYNGIPYLEKSLLDAYKDKGMKIGLTPIWDSIKKSVRSVEDSVLDYRNIDPVTEQEERKLRISFSKDRSKQIQEEIDRRVADYLVTNEQQPSTEQVIEWREEIVDRYAQEQNYDLAKILRVYALTTLAYKHKTKIEDSITLAQNVLHNQREINRTGTGKIQYDAATGQESRRNPETSFTNTKKQFDAFVNGFYGNLKQDEGKTNKQILTKTEQREKKELESQLSELEQAFKDNRISEADYHLYKNTLEAQLKEMGGYAVWSKRGDNVLKWTQLVKMGWNVMSSVANVGFGFISNYIEAAGGQLYTTQQLSKAYSLVGHSVLKNGTFNKFETDTAKKIRSIMDNWDVLKDATHELFQSPLSISLGRFDWLNPYNATQRTEYVNQAPLMIAMMMNATVEHKGQTVNLWDGFGVDGKWNTKKYGDFPVEKVDGVVKNLRHKIDQLNKMNHGNYDPISILGAKSTLLGRALSQFRTWMYEGWAVRTEDYKVDALLGERKGRYRSFLDFFKEHGTGTTAKAVMQGLARSGTFGLALKDFDFTEYQDGTSLKDVDIANMRKLMAETLMYVGIYTSYLMLRQFGEGLEDDEDDMLKYTVNTLINQGLRLKTDIIFYLNPAEFKNLMKDLVPAMSVITDATRFLGSASDFIQGEDEITTGVNAGKSKLLRDTAKAIPLGSPIYKTLNYGAQVFKK